MRLIADSDIPEQELSGWASDAGCKLVTGKFFFSTIFGSSLQSSSEGLYRSLLCCILDKCPELAAEIFAEKDFSSSRSWHAREQMLPISTLKSALNRVVTCQKLESYSFCFFIDGLDEFNNQDDSPLKGKATATATHGDGGRQGNRPWTDA